MAGHPARLRGFTRCASSCVDGRGYDRAVEEDFECPPDHDRVLRAVARQAREMASPRRRTMNVEESSSGERLAEQMASKLCAKISARVVRILSWTLSFAWKRLYASEVYVESGAMKKLREAMLQGNSVVLLPTHQSHLDYMLLSYAMRAEALPMPHIAAGENLDLPGVGAILRRGGAFFIPRVIKGREDEQMVKAVLKAYVDVLVRNGAAVEFFAEGGRSRDGRIAKMRLGLLSLVAQAGNRENQMKQAQAEAEEGDRTALERGPRQVIFVPVTIAYDATLERAAFAEEARGKKKEKESLIGFIKACFEVLMQKRGRVYVTFGDFAALEDFEAQAKQGMQSMGNGEEDESQVLHRHIVGLIGDYLARQLRAKLVITRTDIVAAVLMEQWSSGCRNGWIAWEDLVRKVVWLSKHVESYGATVSVDQDDMETCVRSAVDLLRDVVQVDNSGHEDIGPGTLLRVGHTPTMHLQLWQHVNHVLPWLASKGIVACVLQSMAHAFNRDPKEGVPSAGFSRSLADIVEILGEEIRPFIDLDRPRTGIPGHFKKVRLPKDYYTHEVVQAISELESVGELSFSEDCKTLSRVEAAGDISLFSFVANLVKPLIRTFHSSFYAAKSLGSGPRSESELVELADERCLTELEWTSIVPSIAVIKSACKALLRLEIISTEADEIKRDKALSKFDVKYGTELNLPRLEEGMGGKHVQPASNVPTASSSHRRMFSLSGGSAVQHGNFDSLDNLLRKTRSFIL